MLFRLLYRIRGRTTLANHFDAWFSAQGVSHASAEKGAIIDHPYTDFSH
jgi:hypothetical protein